MLEPSGWEWPLSLSVGILLTRLGVALEGQAEQVCEGTAMLVASHSCGAS